MRRGWETFIEEISAIDKLEELTITTNGILLKEKAKFLKDHKINRINISLQTLKPDRYEWITRGGKLNDVLAGIEEAKKIGFFPIKLNVVLVKNFNEDEIENFVELTKNEPVEVRFIELMPVGESNSNLEFVSNKIVLNRFPDLLPIVEGDLQSPSTCYKMEGYAGQIGLISPLSHNFCANCNRLRLTADGRLKLCLHSNDEISLRDALRKGKNVAEIISEAVMLKPQNHKLEKGEHLKKCMIQVGG